MSDFEPLLTLGEILTVEQCEEWYGHMWTDGDSCCFCGQSWNALYEIVCSPQPDGSVRYRVLDRNRPEQTGTVTFTLPAIRWDDSTEPYEPTGRLTIQVFPDA